MELPGVHRNGLLCFSGASPAKLQQPSLEGQAVLTQRSQSLQDRGRSMQHHLGRSLERGSLVSGENIGECWKMEIICL